MASDGHPELYASPIAELAGDIPLVPQIMVRLLRLCELVCQMGTTAVCMLQYCSAARPKLQGKLVPQQINLWMGAAQEGECCVKKAYKHG